MMKNGLLALTLASVSLWMGCARGIKSIATVSVASNPSGQSVIAVSLTVNYVATIDGVTSNAVNWSVSGNSCSGSACGTVSATGVYTAPTTLPSGKKSMVVNITATSQADSAAQNSASITVLPIMVCVSPPPLAASANNCTNSSPTNVGQGLVQQFTAVTIPDNAPQTFTWSVTCVAAPCGTLTQDLNTSGLAVYKAPAAPPAGCKTNNCVTVTATSTLNPAAPSSTSSKVTILPSRVSGTYALSFSGYDNAGNPVLMAGSVTFSLAGAVSSGVLDVIVGTVGSTGHSHNIIAGSFVPGLAADTNDAGTLTLTSAAGVPTVFHAVVNSIGEIRMVEADANGTGSGVMQLLAITEFNTAAQKYVLLFTGVDAGGNRAGFVGVLPFDGKATSSVAGSISGGQLDVNDNGTPASYSGVSGTYGPLTGPAVPITIFAGGLTFDFNAYIGSGQVSPGNSNPLTLFAVSTDTIDGVHPALAGVLAFQDPSVTYDKTVLNSSSTAHFDGLDSTGVHTAVALAGISGDGNGNDSGSFDALNFGSPPAVVSGQSFTCTYTTGAGGRYIVTLLGNNNTCTAPALPFVFYASGSNRGFLLDQSSAAVMAGGTDPLGNNLSGIFADSALPSTYAAATTGAGTSAANPLAANLLLTYLGFDGAGNQIADATGTFYTPGIQTAAPGTYTTAFTGTGTIVLTPPGAAKPDNYVVYFIDTAHFWMIQTQDVNGNHLTDPSLILVQR